MSVTTNIQQQLKKQIQRICLKLKSGAFFRLSANQKKALHFRLKGLRLQLAQTKPQARRLLALAALVLSTTAAQAQVEGAYKNPINNPFGLTNLGAGDVPSFQAIDIDGDGDLDLSGTFLSYGYGEHSVIYNTGTNTQPSFGALVKDTFNLPTGSDEQFTFSTVLAGDLDGDGDFDLVRNSYSYSGASSTYLSEMHFFENTGTPTAPDFSVSTVPNIGVGNPFGLSVRDQYTAPVALVDIDNDGDLDIVYQVIYGTPEFIWQENIGTATAPDFDAPVTLQQGMQLNPRLIMPRFSDIDLDGDLDVLALGPAYYYSGNAFIGYKENKGTATNANFALSVKDTLNIEATADVDLLTMGDFDNDGDVDVLHFNYDGEVAYQAFNQFPKALASDITAGISSSFTFGLGDFEFSDGDNDAIDSIELLSVPALGDLRLNGIVQQVGKRIAAADISQLEYVHTAPAVTPNYTNFEFKVYDGTAWSDAATMTINIGLVSNIHDTATPKWNLFPNPISDYLHLEAPQSLTDAKVQIFNVQGQLVYETTRTLEAYQTSRLAVAALPKGLYILRVSDEVETWEQRFVRQ